MQSTTNYTPIVSDIKDDKENNPNFPNNVTYGLRRANQMKYLIYLITRTTEQNEREILEGILLELFPDDLLFEALR